MPEHKIIILDESEVFKHVLLQLPVYCILSCQIFIINIHNIKISGLMNGVISDTVAVFMSESLNHSLHQYIQNH